MRTFVVIFLLIFFFLAGGILSEFLLEKHLDAMLFEAEKIKDEKELLQLTESWESLSDRLEVIIDHNELEEISKLLWAMKEEIKYDYDEFMESKAVVLKLMECIKERNTLGIINIF